jgi:DDE superfamily endonuclease
MQAPISTMSDPDDEPSNGNTLILTPEEIMMKGLELVGWPRERIMKRKSEETNIDQYTGLYGVEPCVMAQLVEDLQTTEIATARIDNINIDKLHWAVHFLYRYPTETENESTWKKCANTIREACWYYVDKIRNLKAAKIVWPQFQDSDIWVLSVDGTHLVTLEPGSSEFPKDTSYFSFKHHAAGFNYEIGIDLFRSKCIWLSGPHKAGEYNDAKIYKNFGLHDKLKLLGKKAIADEGYRGFTSTISTHNGLDSQPVREFKTRARQRHEAYNGMLKQFQVLSDRFRCKTNVNESFTAAEKLQMCFEAVNVLVQYKMELTGPLFDI